MNSKNIITGEKIQQLADVYLGYTRNFNSNPIIANEPDKHLIITSIITSYNNPSKIFFYANFIPELARVIHLFENPFILISHNSDYNVYETEETNIILNSNKVIKWYSQNVCFYHPKLLMVPIGLANSMWAHGNLSFFDDPDLTTYIKTKTKKTFFNFSIFTNENIREPCFKILKNHLEWLPTITPLDNLKRLSCYEFCICPEGAGVDCHRIWEALYLKVVPIMIKSAFTETLQRNNIPVVVLDSWDNYMEIEPSLHYLNYIFEDYFFEKFIKEIQL